MAALRCLGYIVVLFWLTISLSITILFWLEVTDTVINIPEFDSLESSDISIITYTVGPIIMAAASTLALCGICTNEPILIRIWMFVLLVLHTLLLVSCLIAQSHVSAAAISFLMTLIALYLMHRLCKQMKRADADRAYTELK